MLTFSKNFLHFLRENLLKTDTKGFNYLLKTQMQVGKYSLEQRRKLPLIILHQVFMVKVNERGCCWATWSQMKRMSLTYQLQFIGTMQAVDGGQLLQSDPYPRLHDYMPELPLFLIFPPLREQSMFKISSCLKWVKFLLPDLIGLFYLYHLLVESK